MTSTLAYPPPAWNATAGPYRTDIVPARLIVEAAHRAPDAPAVLNGSGVAYTYGGLLTAANRLARLLQQRGLGPGDHVGVVGRRRPDTVVALLGVALCGATFVPCHPDWPVLRLGYVLGATRARCVVGAADDLDQWDPCPPGAEGVTDLVLLDVDAEEPAPPTAGRPDVGRSWREVDPAAEPDARVRRVSDLLLADRPSSVLEVGLGTGAVLQHVAPQVDLYAGLDLDEEVVSAGAAWAEDQGLFVDLVAGQTHEVGQRLPGPYDAALLAGADPDLAGPRALRTVLDQLAEVVRPGGRVVISDIPPPGANALAALAGGTWASVQVQGPDGAGRSDPAGSAGEVVLRRAVEPAAGAGPAAVATGPQVWTRWHLERQSESDLPLRARPGDVAYVIFTSGSTGQPKGVSISNTALVNVLQWTTETFGFGPNDRLLQATSFCFDLSIYDVFGLLAVGGSVRLASEAELVEPARLADILLAEPITAWNSAPPLLAWVLPFLTSTDATGPGRDTMRVVFLAGDWIALSMPDEVRTVFPHAEVISFGGATETTIWSTSFRIGTVDPAWPSIPYGRPMRNARYYVLDENRRPLPIGEAGDLYAAGDVLALGYHGDPAQTAQRFVPDPYVPGARMYACGDRGLWRNDGELQFLGRVDHQVKIRGYRVELGEVESVLAGLAGVREAVVVTMDGGGARSLAGFYTRRPAGPSVDVVRAALADRLPEYMVPGQLTLLPELPLTVNGKVDRAALRKLAVAQSTARPGAGQ